MNSQQRRATSLRPPSPDDPSSQAFALAIKCQQNGHLEEAEAAYRKTLSLTPLHARALNNLGNMLTGQGRREAAIAALRSAIAAEPDYAEAAFNLGVLFHKEGSLAEAIATYRIALRLNPTFTEALTNLGAAFLEQDRPDEAVALQRICLTLRPDYARAHLNMGVAFRQQGRIAEAIVSNRRAIACRADYPQGHVNLAHVLLHHGAFAEGWREYEWRWLDGVAGLVLRHPPETLWNGQDVSGRTVLLHAEQGLGDALHFVRYAALFVKLGASVIVEVHAPLVRLLSGQENIHQAVAIGESLPAFDYHLPLMSAPFAFRTRLESIPASIPYILPDAGLTAAWGRRLARLPGLKVGVVWAGDPRPHDFRLTAADRRRSIPLVRLIALLSVAGTSFVSLQKGDAAAQQDDLPPELRPLDLIEDVTDFADTAALTANLDLVITVDTAMAHLAGAMGKPVWILSRFDGCWRWLSDREDSPWYPTARLFRQSAPDDWDAVVARVVTALEGLVRAKIDADFRIALTHHQAGRLSEAEREYLAVLAVDPDHVDSLHLLGVTAYQADRPHRAQTLIERSLALVPQNNMAHNNLGNALRAQGLVDAAIQAFRRALRIRADYPEALINLGKTLLQTRRMKEAEDAFRAAIGTAPDNVHARYCLGVLLQEQNRLAEAVSAYRSVLSLQPADPQAFNNLGNALKDLGYNDKAIAALRIALEIQPTYWEAHYNLGIAFHRSGRLEEALGAYRAALALNPDCAEAQNNLGDALQNLGLVQQAESAHRASLEIRPGYAKAHNNLGIILKEQGRLGDAVAAFCQAVDDRPDYSEAYNNLGVTLMAMERPEEAMAAYRSAIACAPDNAEAQNNLAVLHHRQSRLTDAIAAYARAVLLKPDYAEAQTNLGMARLTIGDEAAGWQGYEWRWKGGMANLTARNFPQPQWRGEALDGRTILLHGEQGFGDVLQFVRYAPAVVARGGKVIIEAYPSLTRLLRTLPGAFQIVPTGEALPFFDCHLPMMSLPHVMGETIGTNQAIIPYLRADPADLALWQQRLAGGTGRKVGLVWAGNPRLQDPGANAVDRRRSIALLRLAPLLATPGIDFISLQTGSAARQIDDLAPDRRFLDLSAELGDFADTAGVMAHLDLLISVDTAAVHLAGAMGKPVWILSRFDGCWRWQIDRDDSPWYPTAKLFRQSAPGDWETVVDHVADNLRQWRDRIPSAGLFLSNSS